MAVTWLLVPVLEKWLISHIFQRCAKNKTKQTESNDMWVYRWQWHDVEQDQRIITRLVEADRKAMATQITIRENHGE